MKKNNQIRIGVIGVSGRGYLAQNWHKPDGKSIIVAGADVKEEFFGEFRKMYGEKVYVTTDYRRMLERNDIDAVAVTSPDFCHEEHAIAALHAGKHVYCEKPLAITVEGCDRILKAWKKSGKRLMVGFNMRYMGEFRCMKEIVDSGTIGEIKAVWVRHFVGYGGKFYFADWHAFRRNTTSLLLQKASHDFDMIHWITGKYTTKVSAFGGLDYFGGNKPKGLECPACPEKETCEEYPDGWLNPGHVYCKFRKGIDVEDNNVVIMDLDGIKAAYLQCHFTPDVCRNYTFIGTEGRVESFDNGKVVVLMKNQPKKWKNLSNRTYEVKATEGTHGGADPVICKDFIDMIVNNSEPVSTPVAGRMSVAVGVAATESLRAGGKVVYVKPLPKRYCQK